MFLVGYRINKFYLENIVPKIFYAKKIDFNVILVIE